MLDMFLYPMNKIMDVGWQHFSFSHENLDVLVMGAQMYLIYVTTITYFESSIFNVIKI